MTGSCGKFHHLVWIRLPDNDVLHGCAHCWYKPQGHHDSASRAYVELQCERSQEAHRLACGGSRIGESFSAGDFWRSS